MQIYCADERIINKIGGHYTVPAKSFVFNMNISAIADVKSRRLYSSSLISRSTLLSHWPWIFLTYARTVSFFAVLESPSYVNVI